MQTFKSFGVSEIFRSTSIVFTVSPSLALRGMSIPERSPSCSGPHAMTSSGFQSSSSCESATSLESAFHSALQSPLARGTGKVACFGGSACGTSTAGFTEGRTRFISVVAKSPIFTRSSMFRSAIERANWNGSPASPSTNTRPASSAYAFPSRYSFFGSSDVYCTEMARLFTFLPATAVFAASTRYTVPLKRHLAPDDHSDIPLERLP